MRHNVGGDGVSRVNRIVESFGLPEYIAHLLPIQLLDGLLNPIRVEHGVGCVQKHGIKSPLPAAKNRRSPEWQPRVGETELCYWFASFDEELTRS